jgi:hypothetical protein
LNFSHLEIGIGLTGFGVGFLFLGIVLFFDRGLLAMGNILFVAGIACIIGLEGTYNFFFKPQKLKGSLFFFAGIAVVLFGWAIIGFFIELYGIYLLFGGFFPAIISFLRRVPVIGSFLNLPGISSIATRLEGSSSAV